MCDINAERAASIAANENATAYTDHQEMLQKEKPDVVFYLYPHPVHTPHKLLMLLSPRLQFLVAKPVAQNIETAQNAKEAIETAGVINQVGYMARYSDITDKAKELVGDRRLTMGNWKVSCENGSNPSGGGENLKFRLDRW